MPLIGAERAPGRRPRRDRPPDAQRASRPHGAVGRVLRAALQFPRDPLFRHRGQVHRAALEGDDQPVRQDPHPDQRKRRRQVADRRIPRRPIAARASSTSRSRPRTSTTPSSALRERGVTFMSVPETYYEAVDARLPGHGEDLARLQRDQILIDGAPGAGPGAAAADLHRNRDRPDLFRDHRAQGQ